MTRRSILIAFATLALTACKGGGSSPSIDAAGAADATNTADAGPSVACGSGTHDDGGVCVADAIGYEIRIAEDPIGADGRTKHEMVVLGTNADGSPATDDVVLTMDRAGGAFTRTSFTLDALGARTYFTPCDSADTGCLGALTFHLALASAPTTVIASRTIQLVAPFEVATAAPCQAGGNIFYIDGNDFIRNGMLTIDTASWTPTANATDLMLSLSPASPLQGNGWLVRISTDQLGTPIAPGIYENALPVTSQTAGHAGLDVSGNGHGCNTITGRYQVWSYDVAAGVLQDTTISFEQHCEGSTTTLLAGCVHYAK